MDKTILHWSYRDFQTVPMDLYLYEDLEEVYLKENFIAQIPNWLLNLTNLKFIHLSGNALTDLPEDIHLLENLEFLDVSNNKLKKLPSTVGRMRTLQRLNVSGNELDMIPSSIGQLKKLENLDLSKNKLKSLPMQMSECCRIKELSINDNPQLLHIPERISNLQSLQSLSAERCGLLYLPVALSKFVDRIHIFQNPSITHIPMIYEKFFANYYDTVQFSPSEFKEQSSFFFVTEKETDSKLLLPFGTSKVFRVPSLENQVPLYDECLHALNRLNMYIPIYNEICLLQSLPKKSMGNHIRMGPIAKCTSRKCFNPLYTCYYFMVVKRRNSTSKLIFTCNFCSMFCANTWNQENSSKYVQIDWEICE